MKTLVIYDTQFGNTERVAKAIALALQEDGDAQAQQVKPLQVLNLQGIDLLVFGCPIIGWKPSPGMQAFLDRIVPGSISGAAACFDTRVRMPRFITGSAVNLMDNLLKKKGVANILPSKYFLVRAKQGPLYTSELEKASAWAHELAGLLKKG